MVASSDCTFQARILRIIFIDTVQLSYGVIENQAEETALDDEPLGKLMVIVGNGVIGERYKPKLFLFKE